MRSAVFLDRDGTLNLDPGHICRPDEIVLIPGVAEALARLQLVGYLLIVVTNQSVVARGYIDEAGVVHIHQRLAHLLEMKGVSLDAFYYCPHHPEGSVPEYRQVCNCRKPLPGLILQAAKDWNVDLPSSYMIGDKVSDLQAAVAAGVRAVLVRTGEGENASRDVVAHQLASYIAEDMSSAVEWILKDRTVGCARSRSG